jgi:hypothetical protein
MHNFLRRPYLENFSVSHHPETCREPESFLAIMGDEKCGCPGLPDDLLQIVDQGFSDNGVKRREGFIEEKDFRRPFSSCP